MALPAIFSTPGDKHQVVVATPGPVRLVLELLLDAVAVAGSWVAWPPIAATLVTIVVVVAIVSGMRRAGWLARGGGPFPDES